MALTVLVSHQDAAVIGIEALNALSRVYGGFFAPANVSVDVSLTDLEGMRLVNKEHRALDEPTDVLSFPLYESLEAIRNETEKGALLGSILISPEKAERYGETLPQLVHHGLLHLSGFDHETDLDGWKQTEGKLLEQLRSEGLTVPGIPL